MLWCAERQSSRIRPPANRIHITARLARNEGRGPPERREPHLAFSKRPSYLKRQKEQQRLARATEKREARRARKHSKESQPGDPEGEAMDDLGMGPEGEPGAEPTEGEESPSQAEAE